MLLRGFLFAALLSLSLYGQGTTSRAVGTVQDTSGASIPGAAVRLTNEGTNGSFTTITSDGGNYVFEAVQPGLYSVTVEAQGFKKFSSKGNVVNIGAPMTVNVTLEVGQVSETVEVAGTYETVQTSTSGNFGNVFAGNVIRDLPIVGTRGRNPLELVLRQPGVVSGANTGGGTHVHGARDRAWNFTIDGIDSNETSAGGGNFSPLRTNPDSLAEFKVLTGNFTAEYGRNSGGQVAMVTKSGTNEFHGDVFWFYRTPRLNANEWENNINARGKRQFVQNIPGFSIGGPVLKNRTFFFFNQQWLRARESRLTDRTVYTQQARQGMFRYVIGGQNRPAGVAGASVDAGGNVVGGITLGTYNIIQNDPERLGLDPTIKGFVDAAPLPNNFNGGDGLNTALFTFTALQLEKQYDTSMKFDHIINDKNTVYARLSFGRQDTTCDAGNGGSEAFPGTGCLVNTQRDPKNYAFNWRTTPSSRLTNELVFGLNRFAFDFVTPTADISKIAPQTAPVQIPVDYLQGNLRRLTTWQIVDNLSYFHGAHTFKFGTNLRLARHQDTRGSIGGANATQQANFSRTIATVDPVAYNIPAGIQQANDRPALETTINFLLGRVGSTSKSFVAENDQFVSKLYDVTAKYNEYDFYFQDSWKLRRNLTMDLGLRWEAKMAPGSDAGRLRRPNQAAVFGGAPSNSLIWEQGDFFRNDLNNFGPSLGLAWDPTGKGKTSVRANYRLAYDRLNTFLISSTILQNLPGVATAQTLQPNVRLRNLQAIPAPTVKPSASAQPPAFSLNNITVMDPNFETPQTHQWGLSLQQEIFNRTVLEVNYIGRRAHNLYGAYNANQVDIFRNGFLDGFRTVQVGGSSPLINQLMGADSRTNPGETGSQAMRRLFATDLANNAVGTVAAALATRQQGGRSLPDLAGLGPYFFQAFPQFANGFNVVDSNDFSTYHALEAQIERRFSNGLSWQFSYTLSKSLDVRSFDPAFTVVSTGNVQSAGSTPSDIGNRKLNYALSDFDRTHVVQSYWVLELPFGRGKHFGNGAGSWTNRLIGGWQVTGFATVSSGRPFTVFSGFNTAAGLSANSTANCTGCTRQDGSIHDEGGLVWYLDPSERARFSQPGAGEFGNTGRNFFRGPGRFSMDAALLKRTAITERVSLELRADVTNLTNTPEFGFPTTVANNPLFGRIRDTVTSASRKIQLGAKIRF